MPHHLAQLQSQAAAVCCFAKSAVAQVLVMCVLLPLLCRASSFSWCCCHQSCLMHASTWTRACECGDSKAAATRVAGVMPAATASCHVAAAGMAVQQHCLNTAADSHTAWSGASSYAQVREHIHSQHAHQAAGCFVHTCIQIPSSCIPHYPTHCAAAGSSRTLVQYAPWPLQELRYRPLLLA